MAIYDKAIPHILKWEGGYVNDPDDRGGETYRGISRVNFPRWTGWAFIDEIKVNAPIAKGEIYPELEEKVKAFYKVEKWNKIYGDNIKDERVALFLFDWFVHSGYHAIKGVQRSTNTTEDGVMGNKTLAAINNADNKLFDRLKAERLKFLNNIVASRPSQAKYLKGWVNRVNSYI